jgi:uncharacterized protein YjgD (DUF1641 family)
MKASRANIRQLKTLEQVVEYLASQQEQLDRIEQAIVALSSKGSSPALDEITSAVLDKLNDDLGKGLTDSGSKTPKAVQRGTTR